MRPVIQTEYRGLSVGLAVGLGRGLERLWKVNTNIIPGALGINAKKPEEKKPGESWDNGEHRVTSESCAPRYRTNTQKGTRYWTV